MGERGVKVNRDVVLVRPETEIVSKQRLGQFVGISGETAGATAISMNLVVIPPGGAAEPHLHKGYETAIYVLKGDVDTRYGPGLRQSLIARQGDFLFIGPDVPHQPVNMSQTEPAMALVARNDPNEQESVMPYDPASEARVVPWVTRLRQSCANCSTTGSHVRRECRSPVVAMR
jgi:uncharacterized RmlC-like cupin family protein